MIIGYIKIFFETLLYLLKNNLAKLINNMPCGCKKNAAAKSTTIAAPKSVSNVQESKPQKKVGTRIIKREIR